MGTLPIDIFITETFSQWITQNPSYVPLVSFIADGLDIFVVIGIVLFLFLHTHRRIGLTNVAITLASGALAYGIALALKVLIARPRPLIAIEQTPELASYVNATGSLPSGHATLFFALAMAVFFFHKRFGIVLFIIATSISVARVAAGVHWASDVALGALLGGMVAWGVYASARRLRLLSEKHEGTLLS